MTACGGGGDSESSEPELAENEVVMVTDGGKEIITEKAEGNIVKDGALNSFSKVSLTGQFEDMGRLASRCVNESSHYYESDNVMVFGDASTTVEDYRLVAGWVESAKDGIAGILGITWTEYLAKRRNIAKFAIDAYIENYADLASIKDSLGVEFTDLSEIEKKSVAWKTYIESDKAERLSLILETSEYAGYGWTAEDVSHNDKIKICLHDEGANSDYFSSYYTGVAIAKPSATIPDDYFLYLRAGLIRMAQEALTHSVHGNPLPVWFSKGQSLYRAGKNSALRSEHDAIDATMYVEEQDEYGFDDQLLKSHYALAYQYIEEALRVANRDRVFAILDVIANDPAVYTQEQLPESYDFTPGETGGLENAAFIKAWDEEIFIDEAGDDLSYSRYKNDYHSLMSKSN